MNANKAFPSPITLLFLTVILLTLAQLLEHMIWPAAQFAGGMLVGLAMVGGGTGFALHALTGRKQ